jgi:lipoprotein signal peptidase
MATRELVRDGALGALAGAALVASDQLLKSWSHALPLFATRPMLGQRVVALTRVLNKGVALGLFSGLPPGRAEPFTRIVPLVALGCLVALIVMRFTRASTIERAALSLLACAGASNAFDHCRGAWVVDPLELRVGAGAYVPFNLADVAIVLAALALVCTHASLILRRRA